MKDQDLSTLSFPGLSNNSTHHSSLLHCFPTQLLHSPFIVVFLIGYSTRHMSVAVSVQESRDAKSPNLPNIHGELLIAR